VWWKAFARNRGGRENLPSSAFILGPNLEAGANADAVHRPAGLINHPRGNARRL